MTVIQPGFADISIELRHALMARSAYLTFGVDPTSGDAQAVATSVSTAVAASGSLRSILDSDVTIREITARLGQDGGEPTVGTIQPMSLGSFTGGVMLPPNCAVLVHKKTALGGRRNRGRMFLPWCVGEGSVDEGGTISPAFLPGIQTAMTAFLAALATANVPMVILHSVGISAVPAATPVQSLSVDALLATQRRRLGR